MQKRVAMLHFAGPPIVGGVETTMAHHARGLADLGYAVRIISGSGAPFDERIETVVDARLGSRDAQVLEVKRELDAGLVSPAFHALVEAQAGLLREALAGCDVCIAHNVHTLNKNLALTTALRSLAEVPVIAWCHDLAWTNPQYLPELYAGHPWDLLRQPWPNTTYVTISAARQAELAELMGLPPADILVIPGGVDASAFLHWTDTTRFIDERLGLLEADLLLLLPTRLTRRKNIGLGLHILHELKKQIALDVRLIVSGPPGPHNPHNPGYLGELLALRSDLGLEAAAHFLYELREPPLVPDDATMANLYHLADGLLFPSLQEGFGLPVLEAGLAGLPIFCTDLAPLHETAQDNALYFDPQGDSPEEIAARIALHYAGDRSYRLKRRVRQQYRWSTIIRDQLVPLL